LPSALVLFNGGASEVRFVLPPSKPELRWELRVDSASPARTGEIGPEPRSFALPAHSICLLHEETVR
jgi:hypothetical protein